MSYIYVSTNQCCPSDVVECGSRQHPRDGVGSSLARQRFVRKLCRCFIVPSSSSSSESSVVLSERSKPDINNTQRKHGTISASYPKSPPRRKYRTHHPRAPALAAWPYRTTSQHVFAQPLIYESPLELDSTIVGIGIRLPIAMSARGASMDVAHFDCDDVGSSRT